MLLRFHRKPNDRIRDLDPIFSGVKSTMRANKWPEQDLGFEICYYVEVDKPLTQTEHQRLAYLLSETFEPDKFGSDTFLEDYPVVGEVGPNLHFETTWSSRAVSICHAIGLTKVRQIEHSVRIGFERESQESAGLFMDLARDSMLQSFYPTPLDTLLLSRNTDPVQVVDVLGEGIEALRRINKERGLSMDEADLAFCYGLFFDVLKRNPTDVELFQIGQANSEHSRHHFFRAQLRIDGVLHHQSLMDIVKEALRANDSSNSLVAFCDDSSAIRGSAVSTLIPVLVDGKYVYTYVERVLHPTFTAETHNHPTLWAPFPGAQTGLGGLIRDLLVMGRAGLARAVSSGYAVSELYLAGYDLPWEQRGTWSDAMEIARAEDILIQGSNGAAEYGNCFGIPTILGFARSFGLTLPEGYRSWRKPVLYVGGLGHVSQENLHKRDPELGMLLVQIGGLAYAIGVGGGAASSMVGGENQSELDFNSVQRGDPELENRLSRVIRTCAEMGEANPFVTAKDLGAGGDSNALPELVEKTGARVFLRSIPLGDPSLSVLQYWGNESQERCAFVVHANHYHTLEEIAWREDTPIEIVGEVTGDKRIVLYDENDDTTPVDLPLDEILGKLPRKTFDLISIPDWRLPLALNSSLSVKEALERVLLLLSVGSKRFLTNKKDRSVTGLVVQQQCVGPNHLPISDHAIMADSHFGITGQVCTIGEQPLKGLINPAAMGRLAIAEALFNMAGAKITHLQDIAYQANWMWAAKLEGEGAKLVEAAQAIRDISIALGIYQDGGKDSLTMAVDMIDPYGVKRRVKAPGQVVIGTYAPMADVYKHVTPEFKEPDGNILFIPLNDGKYRLGGSALAQVYGQVGNEVPDVDDPYKLSQIFEAVQHLVEHDLISAVHDVSDGGLITTLLEMAFAGNVGFDVRIETPEGVIPALFAEEPGLVIETSMRREVEDLLRSRKIPFSILGWVTSELQICLTSGNKENHTLVLDESMVTLREIWEETSFQIEALQSNPFTVEQERRAARETLSPPPYQLTFIPKASAPRLENPPKVAVLRERGSNGDRELAVAFHRAGFEVHDVATTDLVRGLVRLDEYRVLAAPGGFTFADVLGAGKGWAAVTQFNPHAREEVDRFYSREDTLSIGVCNGCQFFALMGKFPFPELDVTQKPRFVRNMSGRFESRFPTLYVTPTNSIFLQGMVGSRLGIWSAHGEGYLEVTEEILERIEKEGLAPLRYVDERGSATTLYPFNPNGSPHGIAALQSHDGRHLMTMPHAERTTQMWNWPWMPEDWKDLEVSPWMKMFQNAYEWCISNPVN